MQHIQEYEIPEAIAELVREGALRDWTYKNDECPAFGTEFRDGYFIRIWVGHPDPEIREESGCRERFFMELLPPGWEYGDPTGVEVVSDDDINVVLSKFRDLVDEHGGHRRKFRLLGDRNPEEGAITLTLVPDGMPALDALQERLGIHGTALYRMVVDRVGKEPGKYLGHGLRGVVYDLGDGRVLKITADASEVKAMSILKGLKHPNLVRVYDAFVVCRGMSGVGVIVREWVGRTLEEIPEFDLLNSDIRNAVDEADDMFSGHYQHELPEPDALKASMDDLLDFLRELRHERGPDELGIVNGLIDGIKELESHGIYGIDFNPKNSAVDDGGNPVIFDIGVVEFGDSPKVDTVGCNPRWPIGSEA